MRLGVFGGSFDPVHYGHLLLAECCCEQGRLDEVWFIPAAVPPHKQSSSLSSAAHRVQMLELAIGGHPAFRVSMLEIERGGVSYTVDTLRALHEQHPDVEPFLLMGADSLFDLTQWKEPEEICKLAVPLVVQRQGSAEPDLEVLAPVSSAAQRTAMRDSQVQMPRIDLSSTDLRRRAASGQSLRYRTPRAVEQYILHEGLYKSPRDGPANQARD